MGGICIDKKDNIYIADLPYSVIREINTAGIITTLAGTGINGYTGDNGPATAAEIQPFGLGIDADGNIYSAEYHNNCIRKIDTLGIITTIAGSATAGYTGDGSSASAAEFFHPAAVKADIYGNIYIADGDNHVVRVINPTGIISTIAGDHTNGDSGDGDLATSAQLSFATDVLVNNTGDVYIVDVGNNNIRYIRSTVAVNIVDNPKQNISMYPNPSNGQFMVRINTVSRESVNVIVKNAIGQKIKELLIKSNKPEIISLDVPNGMYFITASTNENVYSGKVSVMR